MVASLRPKETSVDAVKVLCVAPSSARLPGSLPAGVLALRALMYRISLRFLFYSSVDPIGLISNRVVFLR